MTRDQMQALSRKELAETARKRGIDGWHGMRKDELIDAILALRSASKDRASKSHGANKLAKSQSKTSQTVKPASKNGAVSVKSHTNNGTAHKTPLAKDSSRDTSSTDNRNVFDGGLPTKDLSEKVPKSLPTGYGKDRIVTMVRDPYWLHTYWELSHQSIQRAEAALGQDWHTAKPILRVFDVSAADTTSTSEAIVKD